MEAVRWLPRSLGQVIPPFTSRVIRRSVVRCRSILTATVRPLVTLGTWWMPRRFLEISHRSPPLAFHWRAVNSLWYAPRRMPVASTDARRLTLEESQSIIELRVDPTTGHAIFFNSSDLDAVAIEGYDIFSTSGSLRPADGSWDSLDDQNAAGGDWRESNVSQSRLAELKQAGATTLGINAGDVFALGIPFDANAGSHDLQFSVLRSGEAFPSPGVVTYQAFALPGDYNDDGSVDAADYTEWRDSFGQNVALPNESLTAVTPGVVDQEDYDLWAQRFGDSNSNSFQLAHHSVPEPSSSCLCLLITLIATTVARRLV